MDSYGALVVAVGIGMTVVCLGSLLVNGLRSFGRM